MKIKIRYENEYQTIEVENMELEKWLNISISEEESQEDYEKRIQDVIESFLTIRSLESIHKVDKVIGLDCSCKCSSNLTATSLSKNASRLALTISVKKGILFGIRQCLTKLSDDVVFKTEGIVIKKLFCDLDCYMKLVGIKIDLPICMNTEKMQTIIS